MFRPKKILVPTDFSSASERAADEAMDIAKKYRASLYLLHVIENDVLQCAIDYCLSPDEIEKLRAEILESARKRLDQEISRLRKKGRMAIHGDVKIGMPVESIISEEEERKIDLAVVGAHAKNWFSRMFSARVPERLLRDSAVETLVVR